MVVVVVVVGLVPLFFCPFVFLLSLRCWFVWSFCFSSVPFVFLLSLLFFFCPFCFSSVPFVFLLSLYGVSVLWLVGQMCLPFCWVCSYVWLLCVTFFGRVPHVWVISLCVWVFNNIFGLNIFGCVQHFSGCVQLCGPPDSLLRRTAQNFALFSLSRHNFRSFLYCSRHSVCSLPTLSPKTLHHIVHVSMTDVLDLLWDKETQRDKKKTRTVQKTDIRETCTNNRP